MRLPWGWGPRFSLPDGWIPERGEDHPPCLLFLHHPHHWTPTHRVHTLWSATRL